MDTIGLTADAFGVVVIDVINQRILKSERNQRRVSGQACEKPYTAALELLEDHQVCGALADDATRGSARCLAAEAVPRLPQVTHTFAVFRGVQLKRLGCYKAGMLLLALYSTSDSRTWMRIVCSYSKVRCPKPP